ncbi:hypothetical protein BDU57DRAFT_513885 [Ampelomyces quisqualis]|uniref:Uncharacterized protein n=1 Tax=Ampelomyces quisqualis TaxID=50730 RepID=A0A6A5QQ93_AMPQU|nr:hypothetical protein BDU57DRAFT_513885 [Ampelomyces quisqualis]
MNCGNTGPAYLRVAELPTCRNFPVAPPNTSITTCSAEVASGISCHLGFSVRCFSTDEEVDFGGSLTGQGQLSRKFGLKTPAITVTTRTCHGASARNVKADFEALYCAVVMFVSAVAQRAESVTYTVTEVYHVLVWT